MQRFQIKVNGGGTYYKLQLAGYYEDDSSGWYELSAHPRQVRSFLGVRSLDGQSNALGSAIAVGGSFQPSWVFIQTAYGGIDFHARLPAGES